MEMLQWNGLFALCGFFVHARLHRVSSCFVCYQGNRVVTMVTPHDNQTCKKTQNIDVRVCGVVNQPEYFVLLLDLSAYDLISPNSSRKSSWTGFVSRFVCGCCNACVVKGMQLYIHSIRRWCFVFCYIELNIELRVEFTLTRYDRQERMRHSLSRWLTSKSLYYSDCADYISAEQAYASSKRYQSPLECGKRNALLIRNCCCRLY